MKPMELRGRAKAWQLALLTALAAAALALCAFTPSTAWADVTDVDGNTWTVTTNDDGSIAMSYGSNSITATLSEGTLTFSGSGEMPNLNSSTDEASGSTSDSAGYPWAKWNSSATKIIIEDGITSVGAKSFITWANVTSVEIGKDVTEIGAGAFAQMTSCTGFTVVSGSTSFEADEAGVLYSAGKTALWYYPCAATATSYTVPATVTKLGYNAIGKNNLLESIIFEASSDDDSSLYLGFGSIFGNSKLQKITVNRENVTCAGLVLSQDTALEEISCGSSATKTAFINVLKTAGQVAGVAVYYSNSSSAGGVGATEDGFKYSYDADGAVIYGYAGSETILNIPASVTVGNAAYSVEEIAPYAFYNNDAGRSITSVSIPSSVTHIGRYAFTGGSNAGNATDILKTVEIMSSSISIDQYAFARNTGLVLDMASVNSLTSDESSNAFFGVSSIIISASTPNSIKDVLASTSLHTDTKVYIGSVESSLYCWQYSSGWVATLNVTTFTDSQGLTYTLVLDEDTATAKITSYANINNSDSLTIPEYFEYYDVNGNLAKAQVTSISGLRGQSNSHINNGVKYLTVNASLDMLGVTFVYWEDLVSVTINGTIGELSNCFTGCTNLETFTVTSESAKFGSTVFGDCSSLKIVDLSRVKSVEVCISDATAYHSPTYFYTGTSAATVYVNNQATYETLLTGARKTEESELISCLNDQNIVCITNGGSVDLTSTADTTTGLYSPNNNSDETATSFVGWYSDGIKLASEASAGEVYTAEWKYTIDSYRATSGSFTSPTRDGYVFAGWYKDADYATAIDSGTTSGAAYAKFVDEDVLTIKCQLKSGTTSTSDSTNLRLLTSVDSLMYKNVGFLIKYGTDLSTATATAYPSTTVYKAVTSYDGTTTTINNPADTFGTDASQYYLSAIITDIPYSAFSNVYFDVTPYWTTLDGTVVYGSKWNSQESFTINNLIDAQSTSA